jgi:hypothetical protein
MKRIKGFSQFINEAGSADLLGVARSLTKDLFSAKSKEELQALGKVTPEGKPIVTIGGSSTTSPSSTYTAPVVSAVPGNDDFTLYMQHQQGIAGAKGLIQAMQGTGKLHPETVKTKSGTKYANLVMNVPSDRPQVKSQMIQALDNGDEKTAANLFLNMWKEKWASKGAQAQKAINEPKNAKVKEAITKYCQKYGVPYDFATTVAYIESGFNPSSGNNKYKGVYALSQEEFSKYVPGGSIFNAEDNINAGIQCLKRNIKEFTKYLGPTLATLKIGDWAKNLA